MSTVSSGSDVPTAIIVAPITDCLIPVNSAIEDIVTTVKKGTAEPDGIIDSGIIKAGETFTAKFDKPGTYEYFCAIHTGMKGTVNVS
ncbi:MAG: plastocyanin/azurin family copper-binding protein [Candidatus Nitrosotenuis sp.]